MKKNYNICVLGSGHIANKFHIPSLINNKKIKKIVLCDNNIINLKKTAKKFKIKSFYTNFNKMIKNENIDILNICTPPTLHYQHILKAIKNNLHVFVEKPFVTNLDQFSKIKKLLKNKKIHCYCAYHQRSRPISEEIKKLLKKNKIGKVYYINIVNRKFRGIPKHSKYFSSKKYSGGGPLIDLGSHYFDLVGWFLNFPKIAKISNYCFKNITSMKSEKNYLPFKKFDGEELSVGNVRFENGCLLNYELSYVLNIKEDTSFIEIFGSKGSIKWPLGELIEIKRNKKMIKRIKYKNDLASNKQTKYFINNLSKKFYINSLDQIGFTVNLIKKLYKFK